MNFSGAKKAGVAVLLAGLTLGTAACSGSYDRDEVIDELVNDEGLDRELATCVVDGMEDEFGVDRLDDRGNLTAEEEQMIIDITTSCLLGG